MLKDSFNMERLDGRTFEAGKAYRYDDHQIILITERNGDVRVDEEYISLSAGSLLLLSKGQVSIFGENNFSGYLLSFGDCFWQRTPASASNCKAVLFDDPSVERHLRPAPSDLSAIEDLFATTFHEFESADYSNKADVLAAYLKILIIKIANIHSLLQKDIATYDGRLYQDFLALVRREYGAAHDVSWFAGQLGVTGRKLTDICRQHGSGAKEIIIDQLLSEAKRALQFSTSPIKEIAGDLGFTSPYQFSSFFKTYTGSSPMEYKQRFVKIDI
ncbi:MAG TPA: AraC family transcriptional regulator [Puia sp.]|jgi:AraC-like DNA-binding protein